MLAVEDRLQGQRLPHPGWQGAAVLHHAGEMGANPLQSLALGFARQSGQRLARQIALRQQQRLIRMGNQRLLQQIDAALEGDRIPAVDVVLRLHHRHQGGIIGRPAHPRLGIGLVEGAQQILAARLQHAVHTVATELVLMAEQHPVGIDIAILQIEIGAARLAGDPHTQLLAGHDAPHQSGGAVLHPQRRSHGHLPHQGSGNAIGEAHVLVVVIHAGVKAEHQQIGIQHGMHLGAGVLVAEHADNGDQHDGNEDIETHHLPAAAGILGMGGDGAGQGPGGKRGDIGLCIIILLSRRRAQIGERRVV